MISFRSFLLLFNNTAYPSRRGGGACRALKTKEVENKNLKKYQCICTIHLVSWQALYILLYYDCCLLLFVVLLLLLLPLFISVQSLLLKVVFVPVPSCLYPDREIPRSITSSSFGSGMSKGCKIQWDSVQQYI